MASNRRFRMLALASVVLVGAVAPVRAQDPDDQQRGVARISLMNGEVSVRRGDAAEWVAGVVNAPLMTDDRISTAPNSRAEVQFDASNLIRIGGNAEVRIAHLEYGRYQLEIARGTVTYVVLRTNTTKVEVDTPNVSVRPDKRGVYRISVSEAGETQVIARAGEVEVFTPRGSEWVNAGKMMIARGTAADPEFQIVDAPALDEWDTWNQNRDRTLTQSTSTQYVPEGVYGAEDLDQYGTWTDVPSYGYVWRPSAVAVDWAPYRYGRWAWQDWYGWSWVSYDPWGWAPYHYGRWFWDTGYGWCWYPGVRGRRHYWSPALVGWFGFGHGGVGVGFGWGNVGWVPLAPYETFHPWWGRGYYGRGFHQNINVTNVNITNVYRNARIGNGISGVGYNDFRNGRFGSISRFSGNQVREAGLIRGQMPVEPGRQHLQFTNRSAAFVPRESRNTTFYSRERPAAAQRIPFEQQRQAFTGQSRVAQAAPGGNTRPQSAGPQNSQSRWQRFGAPSDGGARPGGRSTFENTRPAGAAPQNRGNWQRFGEPNSALRQSMRGNDGPAAGGGVVRERAPVRTYEAPGGSPSRGAFGGGNRMGGQSPRTYEAPSTSPRGNFGNGGGGGVRERAPARTYQAPSMSPRGNFGNRGMSAPRGGFGGGGGMSMPRSRESGGGGFSAPRSSAPRGGGFSAPRSGGGGGFSAPRGGGSSGPRSGGGGRPAGGSAGRSRGR